MTCLIALVGISFLIVQCIVRLPCYTSRAPSFLFLYFQHGNQQVVLVISVPARISTPCTCLPGYYWCVVGLIVRYW